MFFDILYNILIYPIEFIIEILFYLFNHVFKSSYGISLFLLSLCINFLSLPLYNIAESWQAKERAIQDKMKPMIDNIKAVYKGDQRYLLIRACQRINSYKTIYAFRGTLGLLIQIPFFMAAYNFVHSLTGLNGQSFLFIKDLSKPDALIHIGNISVNLLPFLMTLFSLLAGFVYAKKLKFKESLPLYIVSLIFLVLLYTSPSGLLFYWTINCLFSLIKNIVIEYKLYSYINKNILLKVYNVLFILLSLIFITFFILGNIEREGYLKAFKLLKNDNVYNVSIGYYSSVFKNSDIYGVAVNKDKLDSRIINIEFEKNGSPFGVVTLNDNIENIGALKVYYKLFIKKDIVFCFILLLIICLLLNIRRFINIKLFDFNNLFTSKLFLKNRNKLVLLSCLVISLLSGLFIPSSLIGSSPQEFKDPFNLIFNDLSISIGLFLFYPIFIYLLFSERVKNILTSILICFAAIVLINTFIMVGNYININADFVFDNTDLLKASSSQTILNMLLILSVILIFLFMLIKNRIMFIINMYIIIIIALVSVSIFDFTKIIKEHKKISEIELYNEQKDKNNSNYIFSLSKTGKNIFIFILDRASNSYWIDAFERFPKYKELFDGFTFYNNNVSLASTTIGISALYGGYDYLPYEMSTNGKYILKDKHNESLLMLPIALEKYGYKSAILEPVYANYKMIPDLTIFKNYTNINAFNNDAVYENSIHSYSNNMDVISSNENIMIRFSIFRMLPINLRYSFYSDGNWFNINNFDINLSIYTYAILKNTKNLINIKEKGNYYNILHNMITHEPQFFASDFLPHFYSKPSAQEDLEIYKDEFSTKHFYANVASMNAVLEFLDFLKNNDIYDNTKIIIVSDHGFTFNGLQKYNFDTNYAKTINSFHSILLYKDFNSRGEIKIDSSFSTMADVPYLATKHIAGIKNPFTGNLIINDYKTNGVYIISSVEWQPNLQYSNMYSFRKFYYVKDNIFDTNNWKKFLTDLKNKNIVEEVEFVYDGS